MPNYAITYQLDIYNAAGTSVALTYTSIAGGTNPYLSDTPVGDGQEFNPLTGKGRRGQYTGRIIDVVTSGTTRAVTGNLEDSLFRQQLMRRKAILKMIIDGATTVVLCAGLLTDLRLVNTLEYQYTVTDQTRVQGDQKIFMPRAAALVIAAGAAAGATSITVAPLPIAIAKNERLNFGAGKTGVVSAAAAAGVTSVSVDALPKALTSGDQSTYREPVAAFLARWPKRGCVLGGPVIGGFLNQQDSGGWTMRYERYDDQHPFLRFISGVSVGGGRALTDVTNEWLGPAANRAAGKFSYLTPDEARLPRGPVTTFEQASAQALANDLLLEILTTGGTSVGYYRASFYDLPRPDQEVFLVDLNRDRQGIFLRDSAGLSPGAEYRVRAITATASEISPIYGDMHPVDWATTILTELGYAYDAASAATVKGAIGADLLVAHRIPGPEVGSAWLEAEIQGPFGIGLRMGDDREVEFFSGRIFANSAPATVITDADVITPEEGGAGEVFAISESTAIASAVCHAKKFETLSSFSQRTGIVLQEVPADGVLVSDVRIERLNGDPGVVGNAEHSWTLSGMVHRLDSYEPANDFLDLAIREIFDRYGRGVIECELPLLRGGSGDALRIGDECIVRLSQLPNKNKRYGDDTSVGGRAMQIVRYTPRASGALVKLLDSGPNAAAYGTAPTLSIAAATSSVFSTAFLARRVAALTITNAATLNADGAGAYVLMAVNSGTPAATDYARVMWFNPGEIPTAAFNLPTVLGGRRVWAKAVAVKAGVRPSAASSAVNVSLTSIAPVSGLSVTPDATDGTQVVIGWTPAESDHLVDVYRRRTGTAASDNVRIAELSPGSTQYTDVTARPGVDYTYSVQHRHPVQNDTSTLVTGTGTTPAMTSATIAALLATPNGARGFAGAQDDAFHLDNTPGLYGIAVRAAFQPSEVEAEVSVDGGTTYTPIGQVPSRQGTWTPITDIGPNDGVARKLRARHFRPGHSRRDCIAAYSVAEVAGMPLAVAAALGSAVVASAWSDVVTVTPYVDQAIQRTTKTLRVPSTAFRPWNARTTPWVADDGDVYADEATAICIGYAAPQLPVGATVTALRARVYGVHANGAIAITFRKTVDSTATVLAGLYATVSGNLGGYATAAQSLTEIIGADAYDLSVIIDNQFTPNPDDVRMSWVELDYTSPSLDISL